MPIRGKLVVLMKPQWEKFNGRPFRNRASNEVRVTLAPQGLIYLNGKAYDALKQPAAVEILFDGNRRIIGLKSTALRHTNAFPLSRHVGNYWRICAAAFCQHFRIKPRNTMLFQNVDLDNEGVMMLDLMNTVTVTRGAR